MVTAVTGLISDLDNVTEGGIVPITFSYQWQQGNGTTFTNIAGADNESFTVGPAQRGQQLRVVVSFTDNKGTTEQLISAATEQVADIFVGTAAADTWVGTPGDDIASGMGGNDNLNGMGGNDFIAEVAATTSSRAVPVTHHPVRWHRRRV